MKTFKDGVFADGTSFPANTIFKGSASFGANTSFGADTYFKDFVPAFKENTSLGPRAIVMDLHVIDFLMLYLPGRSAITALSHIEGVSFGYEGYLYRTVDALKVELSLEDFRPVLDSIELTMLRNRTK